jgi:hypothetical protein
MTAHTFLMFALVTAALTLYFILLMRFKPSTEAKLYTFMQQRPIKKKRKLPTAKTSTSPKSEETTVQEIREKECPHYLGYLTTLPKGTSFPEECFGCRQVIRCMRIEPTETIESFYLGAAKPEEASQ